MVEVIDLTDWRPLNVIKLRWIYHQIQERVRRGVRVDLLGAEEDLAFFALVNASPLDSSKSSSPHVPVMVSEVLAALDLSPGMTVVDATAGAGGHTEAIAQLVGEQGRVIAIDRDPDFLRATARKLKPRYPWILFKVGDFARLRSILNELGIQLVHGVLMDLGLSSYHLERSGRGFSFRREEPLDMRFDPREGQPASWVLQHLSERELQTLFRVYGEEPWARRIAREIVRERKHRPIQTTGDLNAIIDRVVPYPHRSKAKARIYQALRIYVNRELDRVARGLVEAVQALEPQGRLVVLAYHSLEDRLVKALKNVSGLRPLFKKPLTPSEEEVLGNPRARSAKLRAYVKEGEIDEAWLLAHLRAVLPVVGRHGAF